MPSKPPSTTQESDHDADPADDGSVRGQAPEVPVSVHGPPRNSPRQLPNVVPRIQNSQQRSSSEDRRSPEGGRLSPPARPQRSGGRHMGELALVRSGWGSLGYGAQLGDHSRL
jgi:hypothetical protein